MRKLGRWLPVDENMLLIGLAVCVGVSTGAGIYVFREGIAFFEQLVHADLLHDLPLGKWGMIPLLALAGLIVGGMMHIFVGEQRHHGVAGIIEAVALVGGRLPYAQMPFKAVASALSIGAGASVGPEDPSVQIGANLGSFFGQKLSLTEERTRLLTAAGGASAIAAAFNAPIAGVFFALEVILADFTTGSIGVVVLSAVMSAVFTQSIGHQGPELGIRNYVLGGPEQVPFYIVLGLLAAPIGVFFIRAVYWQHDQWHKIHLSRPLKTALAGALVGAIGVAYPQIYGTGHHTMNEILNTGGGDFTIQLLTMLVIIKIISTSISMAGGFVGGIFAPSLFVGAMLGGAYGRLLERLVPDPLHIGDPAAYAIAGMGAMMAGVVRAPITAILLIFELTNNYQLILPIMLTTVVCVYLAERMESGGIYTLGLRRQGFHIQQGRDVDLMQSLLVDEVMRVPPPVIHPDATLTELRDTFRSLGSRALCVATDHDRLIGIVTLSDLQKAYEQASGVPSLLSAHVQDICTRDVITISPGEPLWAAIRLMGQYDFQTLPVVSADHHLVGLIRRNDIMRGYGIAVARKWESQYTQTQIRLSNLVDEKVLHLRVSHHSKVAGKKIRDLTLPAESVIASIRRGNKTVLPHGDTELYAHDVLTLIADPGVEPDLRRLVEEPA